ncbi:MAG: DUF1475 family protein [Pirellulaceae bacterium]
MMRLVLIAVFLAIEVAMIGMTTWASFDRAVWNVRGEVLADRWFQATLLDAYLAFLTFYLWVFYKEPTILRRTVWFVLIMALGNMAMAAYVLVQLIRWRDSEGFAALLLRRTT